MFLYAAQSWWRQMCSVLPTKLKLILSGSCLLFLGENKSTFIDGNLSLSLQQGANVTTAETSRWGWYERPSSALSRLTASAKHLLLLHLLPFFFCSLSNGWNERTDQTITESHINSGRFGQMGDGNSLTEHSACHFHTTWNLSLVVLFTSVAVYFIYSNDSFHSASFDIIRWRWKSCQSSTSFAIQFAISFCSSHIPACYPHYHHCPNGLRSPVLLAKPKIYFPSSSEIFDYTNNPLWKDFNLCINIKVGKIYFTCTCNFIIYKELGTLKSIMPLWQSLQPVFLPYFLCNQWTLRAFTIFSGRVNCVN